MRKETDDQTAAPGDVDGVVGGRVRPEISCWSNSRISCTPAPGTVAQIIDWPRSARAFGHAAILSGSHFSAASRCCFLSASVIRSSQRTIAISRPLALFHSLVPAFTFVATQPLIASPPAALRAALPVHRDPRHGLRTSPLGPRAGQLPPTSSRRTKSSSHIARASIRCIDVYPTRARYPVKY